MGIAAYVNQKDQQRLKTEAQAQTMQDRANREEMGRQLSESALLNELDSSSRREAALQAQITAMDTANRNQAVDAQQQEKQQRAERELQKLRRQRAQLQEQVNCERQRKQFSIENA
ncbi:MAG: hypothetical protein R6W06_03830 [Prochlorococcaceae cyanobacterium]